MELNDNYREMIIGEINFSVKNMDKVPEASQKLYYFSAIFGVFHRVLNIEYHPQLVFAHFVLRTTHDTFQSRLSSIKQGGDITVELSNEQFVMLSKLSKELAQTLKKNQDIDDTLKKFVILSYSTTGNGYYLMQKEVLKI